MPECTRCGTNTTRNALASEAPVENSKNGVVWLCDNCMDDFNEFLGEKDDFTELLKVAHEKGKRQGVKDVREHERKDDE